MASLRLILPLLLFAISAAAQPAPPILPSPIPSFVDAVDTLANSGYIAMSFTLQLIAPTLPLPSAVITPLTVFSPPDIAFSTAGQPSLAGLLLHFSPVSFSPSALLSFPFSTSIPSLSPGKHLTITSNRSGMISINNVGVTEIPLHDDGFVIIYAVDGFFDLGFTPPLTSSASNPKSNFICTALGAVSRFKEVAGVLKSRGRSIIASFLELQLLGFLDRQQGGDWTVFGPADQELVKFSSDFLEYSSLFTRHLTRCKVRWSDVEEAENTTAAIYNVKGFPLNISKDRADEMLTVNGVEITFPDMYDSEWLVVHGIKDVILLPELFDKEELVEEFP